MLQKHIFETPTSYPKTFPKNPALKKFIIFSWKKAFLIVSPKKTPARFGLSSQKHALKKFLIFSQKNSLVFWKRKSQKNPYISGNWTFLYFRRQNFFILQEREVSYTFWKRTFLYFRRQNFLLFLERYIQNPSIFRTRSIFRISTNLELQDYSEHWHTQNHGIFKNMTYLEIEAHSEHWQTSTMECFAKNSCLAHLKRVLIFSENGTFQL